MSGHLNSYKKGIDLEFLKQYCIDNGRIQTMKHGEVFTVADRPSHHFAYIEKGCFKYIVHNESENKDYITGFAFANEFVADYPNCLYGLSSKVNIEASTDSKIYVVDGSELYGIINESPQMLQLGIKIMENLFNQLYANYLDHYRLDARGRYECLLRRCPLIVQELSLKDIASYLKMHPNTISKIRHEITFSE